MNIASLIFAASFVQANNTPPFYPRSTQTNQSIGAINANLNDITGRNRDKLVSVVSDVDCSLNGGALVGATEKGGYIYGGSCTVLASTGTLLSNSSTTTSGFGGSPSTSFGVCNTTLTIITTGNRVAVSFNGAIATNAAGANESVNVLQDGAYVSPYTSTLGMNTCFAAASTECSPAFRVILPAPSIASHQYCLTQKASAGTPSWETTNSTPSFQVEEVR